MDSPGLSEPLLPVTLPTPVTRDRKNIGPTTRCGLPCDSSKKEWRTG